MTVDFQKCSTLKHKGHVYWPGALWFWPDWQFWRNLHPPPAHLQVPAADWAQSLSEPRRHGRTGDSVRETEIQWHLWIWVWIVGAVSGCGTGTSQFCMGKSGQQCIPNTIDNGMLAMKLLLNSALRTNTSVITAMVRSLHVKLFSNRRLGWKNLSLVVSKLKKRRELKNT